MERELSPTNNDPQLSELRSLCDAGEISQWTRGLVALYDADPTIVQSCNARELELLWINQRLTEFEYMRLAARAAEVAYNQTLEKRAPTRTEQRGSMRDLFPFLDLEEL